MSTWFTVNLDTTAPPLTVVSLSVSGDRSVRVEYETDWVDAVRVAAHFQDQDTGVLDLVEFDQGDLRGVLPAGSSLTGVLRIVAVDSVWNSTTLAVGHGADVPTPAVVARGRTGALVDEFSGLLARARAGFIARPPF